MLFFVSYLKNPESSQTSEELELFFEDEYGGCWHCPCSYTKEADVVFTHKRDIVLPASFSYGNGDAKSIPHMLDRLLNTRQVQKRIKRMSTEQHCYQDAM